MKKADLHMHTTYSDGAYPLEQLINLAKSKNLNYISITDHDTLIGSREAYTKYNSDELKIIVGIELSTDRNGESIHVLGFFKNADNLDELDKFLADQRQMRKVRAEKIKNALYEHFQIVLDMSFSEKLYSITRGSIANEIIKQGHPYTKQQIFDLMIGEGKPAYYPSTKLDTKDAIKLIHKHQGYAVLAHPTLVRRNNIEELVKLGFDGIEAVYPRNKSGDEEVYRMLAKKYNLFITAGSDFHDFDDGQHGNIGDVTLSGEDLEIFLNKLEVK